jgi:excisionase family DNA binding protein
MGQILTIEQAAEMLHLNPQVVRQYLREGKLPGRKVGRHWRVVEDDLTRFVRSGNNPILRARDDRIREWQSLSYEEKLQRIDEVRGKYADVQFSSDDLVRERREEVEREEIRSWERQGKASSGSWEARERWLALSQEERDRLVDEGLGICAGRRRTLDDFLREKHEEIDEENRRAEERHVAWLERNKDVS